MKNEEFNRFIDELKQDSNQNVDLDLNKEKEVFEAITKGIKAFGEAELRKELAQIHEESVRNKQQKTRYFIGLAASIALIVGVFFFTKQPNASQETPVAKPLQLKKENAPNFADSASYNIYNQDSTK